MLEAKLLRCCNLRNTKTLHSMLLEVESIINFRPLTNMVLEIELEILTPNHFLLSSSIGSKPLGPLQDDSRILRRTCA